MAFAEKQLSVTRLQYVCSDFRKLLSALLFQIIFLKDKAEGNRIKNKSTTFK